MLHPTELFLFTGSLLVCARNAWPQRDGDSPGRQERHF